MEIQLARACFSSDEQYARYLEEFAQRQHERRQHAHARVKQMHDAKRVTVYEDENVIVDQTPIGKIIYDKKAFYKEALGDMHISG